MPTSTDDGVRCGVCGAVLENELALEEHKEVHAEQLAEGEPMVSAHKCAFCSASFRTPEELRDHHATAHRK
ncbi:MAG TPA: C2H2-type zinc finger protein [Thermoplasmata archaeon]|nr:C2H2-type zinc finger protein [Thermoplasmata archaeon]